MLTSYLGLSFFKQLKLAVGLHIRAESLPVGHWDTHNRLDCIKNKLLDRSMRYSIHMDIEEHRIHRECLPNH